MADDPDARAIVRAGAPAAWEAVTIGILIDLGADGLTSAIAGTAVGLAYALDQATGRRREERLGQLVADVAVHLGGPDHLAAAVLATDETAELTRRVLEAAAHTTLPDKLRALGTVLSRALDGTDTIDTALLIASALQDLEAPHVRALRIIEDLDTLKPKPGEMVSKVPGVSLPEMRRGLHGQDGALEAVVGTLTVHGLVRDVAAGGFGGGEPRYAVTPLATDVLDLLTDHAE